LSHTLRIGTRGSRLALTQARWVQAALQRLCPELSVELVTVRTTGDRFLDAPLSTIGGKGVFVKEIEDALTAGRIDCAVHSMKDVPTELAPGLVIGAIPPREAAHDVLISRARVPLAELPRGARVGTSSLRRMALLRAQRRDVEVQALRGNVDTRLRKLDGGELDAVVLAAAGLHRLGITRPGAVALDPEDFIPAIGQGALAIETRDDATRTPLLALDDPETRIAVSAERAFLARVGGSCRTPLAAYATVEAGHLDLRALIANPDGIRVVRGRRDGATADATDLGRELADELLNRGGREILSALDEAGHGW
jgi:hydroxymethylbilane synthase